MCPKVRHDEGQASWVDTGVRELRRIGCVGIGRLTRSRCSNDTTGLGQSVALSFCHLTLLSGSSD